VKRVPGAIILAVSCGVLCACAETVTRPSAPRLVQPATEPPSNALSNAAQPASPPKQTDPPVREEPQPSTPDSSVPEELAKQGYVSIDGALRPDGICRDVVPSKKNETRTPQRPALVEVLSLEDYNGDGKAYEFALFEQQACMGLQTALLGYPSDFPALCDRRAKGKRRATSPRQRQRSDLSQMTAPRLSRARAPELGLQERSHH
jgi:hypothetical protein